MLPSMDTKPMMRPTVRTQFRGLNNNLSAQDGEIVWMENMSSREYPLLANRPGRKYSGYSSGGPTGIGAVDKPFWTGNGQFVYDGTAYWSVDPDTRKQFAYMNGMIFIFPDKKYFDINALEVRNLGVSATTNGATFMNGTYTGVPATANTIYKAGAAWAFKPGDGLTISGCVTHRENNKTAIVREVEGDYLRFDENTFTLNSTIMYTVGEEGLVAGTYYFTVGESTYHFFLYTDLSEGDSLTWIGGVIAVSVSGSVTTISVAPGEDGEFLEFADIPTDYSEAGNITVTRFVPDMDFICVNENRLWGCKGDTIYASALGDPFNFDVFDGLSSDSWQSVVPDEGDFTACISYGGYPIFFKENSICKVQGDKPSNFQWTLSSKFGVKTGCERSLAVAGETLYYLSRAGVCAYNGGAPKVISDPLGVNIKWFDAAAGSDGIRYYISMQGLGNGWNLFVYDTRYGEWFHEDDKRVLGFAFWDDGLYYMSGLGEIWRIDGTKGTLDEGPVEWQVKFADSDNFYETTDSNSQNKKGPLRILIRATLEKNTEVVVKIKYDDGTTQTVGTITGSSSAKKKTYIIPLILRRCDHYRLSLDGVGDAVIYSISMERYSGSQYQGSSNVTLPSQA